MTTTDDAERQARLLVLGAEAARPKPAARRILPKTPRSSLQEELIAMEKEAKRLEDAQPKPSL